MKSLTKKAESALIKKAEEKPLVTLPRLGIAYGILLALLERRKRLQEEELSSAITEAIQEVISKPVNYEGWAAKIFKVRSLEKQEDAASIKAIDEAIKPLEDLPTPETVFENFQQQILGKLISAPEYTKLRREIDQAMWDYRITEEERLDLRLHLDQARVTTQTKELTALAPGELERLGLAPRGLEVRREESTGFGIVNPRPVAKAIAEVPEVKVTGETVPPAEIVKLELTGPLGPITAPTLATGLPCVPNYQTLSASDYGYYTNAGTVMLTLDTANYRLQKVGELVEAGSEFLEGPTWTPVPPLTIGSKLVIYSHFHRLRLAPTVHSTDGYFTVPAAPTIPTTAWSFWLPTTAAGTTISQIPYTYTSTPGVGGWTNIALTTGGSKKGDNE